jgi:hypothetical protein
MLIDITEAERNILADLARNEIADIEQGIISYGTKDDDMDTISLLMEAITALGEEVASDALAG